jgi:tryptophanyl-tRNA synthetase
MSKSDPHPGHAIRLLDTPEEIEGKIMRATTDSLREIRFDEARPGITNLLTIYESFTGLNRTEIESRFTGKGYSVFKKELAEVIVEGLRPLQTRFRELMADPRRLETVFEDGASRVRPLAERTLARIKERIGIG